MKLQDNIQTELPFVVYKKPNSGKVHIIQQNNSRLYSDKQLQTKGFYFAPFDLNNHPVVVFPNKESTLQSFFLHQFSMENKNKNKIKKNTYKKAKNKHIQQVTEAIAYIKTGQVQKVIISRTQNISLLEFDIFQSLLQLMLQYDNSFVYAWHHPKIGIWLGATPEVLGTYKNEYFQTMALAGTVPVASGKAVIWQKKEILEQQFVTNYILKKLQALSEQINISKPSTLYQGKIAHIKTVLSAKITKDKVPALILNLHPTPAVCGLPADKAQQLITQIESYDRKYYTGFIGNIHEDTAEVFVNLRCLEIHDNQATLYIGGGITTDSQPKKEWQETVFKSEVLLGVL